MDGILLLLLLLLLLLPLFSLSLSLCCWLVVVVLTQTDSQAHVFANCDCRDGFRGAEDLKMVTGLPPPVSWQKTRAVIFSINCLVVVEAMVMVIGDAGM
jgi:hypothetical protein